MATVLKFAVLLFLLLGPHWAEARLAYYSDYFSFVGHDEQGRVAFALDTNRGQDGDQFQAEHFAVLHSEGEGWVKVEGSGNYPNSEGKLVEIPDSEHFRFSGSVTAGMRIDSPINHLSLQVNPIPNLLERRRGQDRYWMGVADATLQWQGRTLEGRVIYEYISFENRNRLARIYWRNWRDFHGLYLRLQHPESGAVGDFYLHRQSGEEQDSLTGNLLGFAVIGDKLLTLDQARIEVTGNRLALGFYRWPQGWRGSWSDSEAELAIELQMTQQKNISNWVIGGFAMGIVRGTVRYGGVVWDAYGLGEIIK